MSSDNKRALLAVIFSGIILFGWQHFFGPKTSPNNLPAATATTNVTPSVTPTIGATTSNNPAVTGEVSNNQSLTNFTLVNGGYSFVINNQLQFIDSTNSLTSFAFLETVGGPDSFSLEIEQSGVFSKVWLNLVQIDAKTVEGSNDVLGLKARFSLDDLGKLNYTLNSTTAYKYRVLLHTSKKELDGGHHREFSFLAKDLEKFSLGKADEGEGEMKWLAIDFNFHLFSMIFKDKKLSTFSVTEAGDFIAKFVNPLTSLEGSFVFSKKDYDLLTKLGDSLNQAIDYGMWGIFAIPILRALQFFYRYVPNYGISIILLTLFIRLLTFPLQYKSFKSMKKMQELQPELSKLREKYKEDPQKLQKETMDLFKKAGANPLGGCLPLLLQMPIFFAFYKVLFNSTELMGAPFMLWITDLSHKDPYYVLPLLMAGSMFLQQKMTPSPSADPTQQKIMMFMPLIFGIIMKDLPSGLTLYIFVSTILGIGQQYFVYKKS
jgi:YidC/Oxa1 family membrane protein insertase